MGSTTAIALCLAYIGGLLATSVAWGGVVILGLGICFAVVLPRYWRTGPNRRIWLAAGGIALLASLYFQVRDPRPQANDISQFAPTEDQRSPQIVWVQGQVDSLPHVTRSQNAQFWLNADQLDNSHRQIGTAQASQAVTGRLYVTVPLLQATGLHPGQRVEVAGSLYKPKPAANPGAFDFQAYLKQDGGFAGLRGQQVEVLPGQTEHWDWWMVQQQIVRSQLRWLNSAEGSLLSAMVLGSKPVDIPAELKDTFVRVGLAAALAASGFQTTLILGVLLALTRRFSERVQAIAGSIALIVFVGLTGLQPSVLRATIMGFGSMAALLVNRTIQPLGSLLVAAVLLLIWNPLWIWNLGFQLSFLATMGLLVTVPPLTQRLDWLPSAIAPLIAVPIAAILWTLPIQLYAFGVLSPYSIPVNILTTPLISVISIGGMVSALFTVIWSPAGSAIAWSLKYPTQLLIAIVDWFGHLPGTAYATGTVSPLLAIALYGLILLAWLQPWWQRRWWMALFLGVVLTLVPLWQARTNQVQVTVLATTKDPVLVLQDRGQVAVINSGDETTANLTILPFLQQQGVNQIDWAVATSAIAPGQTGWTAIQQRLPIHFLYGAFNSNADRPLPVQTTYPPSMVVAGQSIRFGSDQMTLLQTTPTLATLQLRDRTWLWLGALPVDQQAHLVSTGTVNPVEVLWWSGKRLHPELIARLKPTVAIASAKTIHPDTEAHLRQLGTRLYCTGHDGAIQWTPTQGFKTTLDPSENNPPAL
jgi:competence protein ComEC